VSIQAENRLKLLFELGLDLTPFNGPTPSESGHLSLLCEEMAESPILDPAGSA
jgi:hypothetical protein